MGTTTPDRRAQAPVACTIGFQIIIFKKTLDGFFLLHAAHRAQIESAHLAHTKNDVFLFNADMGGGGVD